MPKFLIDVNLPTKFSLWHTEDFIFVKDIDPFLQDTHIWEFAKENNLIIVTKDRDFYDRVLLSTPPPSVIHIRVGNMKMAQFHSFMHQIWQNTLELIENHKLVLVFSDRVEGIN